MTPGALVRRRTMEARLVIDLIYILTTLSFFALMIAYVAACDRLGRSADVERASKDQP